ncbi:mucin-12-like [Choloepus didactylus]|uniref:mucin-12-like n=1 Tax=Choloepus didactylus TaxID=27675 RepID=UPI00189D4096|nr:mucin-12-like [Choloepus didactylus]
MLRVALASVCRMAKSSTHSPVPGLNTTSTLHPPFISTDATVMMTHFPATTARQCQNGGTWDGKQCRCKQGYFGYSCQSLLDSIPIDIPEKINATLGVIVKVVNRIFTEELQNTSSPAYRTFNELFKKRMDDIYRDKDFPQYRGVNITKLLSGSVVVEHDVLLEANYTPEFKEAFANLTKLVKVKIVNKTQSLPNDYDTCQNPSILCFSEESPRVSDSATLSFDPQEQCASKAAEDFAQFYFVEELDGKLTCVNNCTPGTRVQMDCHQGMCQLQRSGPRCLCSETDTHWNWGETCERSTSKALVYGSVGAVAVLLVVVVVTLAIFLGQSRSKLHSRHKYDVSHEWQREDVPGSFQNTGIWEDKSLKEDKFGLESVYSHFHPTLENVDPTAELHFQRPKVVTPPQ